MTTDQLSFDSLPAVTERLETARSVTDLVASDPLHSREREAVIEAMKADADAHGGHVDPNRVRLIVPSWVGPRVLSSMYGALRRRHVLKAAEWTLNEDKKGRNDGKPLRTYRWVA